MEATTTAQQATPEVLRYWGGRCLPSSRGTVIALRTEGLKLWLWSVRRSISHNNATSCCLYSVTHPSITTNGGETRYFFLSAFPSLWEEVTCHAPLSPLKREAIQNTGALHFAFHRLLFFSLHKHTHSHTQTHIRRPLIPSTVSEGKGCTSHH